MCRTSDRAPKPAATATLSTIPKFFPLQKYLNKAVKDALHANAGASTLGNQPPDDSNAARHVPFSLFLHANPGIGIHHYAGYHDDEMHYSASLLKVAAMYAAFKLKSEAKALANSGATFANPTPFFNALSQKFTSADAVVSIRNAGVGLKPNYADILTVSGFGGSGVPQVTFAPSFYHGLVTDHALFETYRTIRRALPLGPDGKHIENAASQAAYAKVGHMYKMIVVSDNDSAAACIRRLGYAYINVKLMSDGFYVPDASDPSKSKGIWLAGDFAGGTRVEVPCVNDPPTAAQVTTSRQMARLFSLVQLGRRTNPDSSLIDHDSSQDMYELLHEAQTVDTSWLSYDWSRANLVTHLFDVDGVKIGLGNLKPNTPPKGPSVYSEGEILIWKGDADKLAKLNLDGTIAVVWQNILADTGQWDGIVSVIENTISGFLNQTPV